MIPEPNSRRRFLRQPVGLIAAAVVLSGCTTAPPPPPVPPPTTKSTCPAPGAAITLGNVEAAMGLRVLSLVLTNCGTSAYSVNGYPALRILDAASAPIEVAIGKGTATVSKVDYFSEVPAPVVLQPGEEAVAGLVWRNTVTDSTVKATLGTFVDVAPTAADAWQQVKPEGGVDLGTTGKVGLSAWSRRPAPKK